MEFSESGWSQSESSACFFIMNSQEDDSQPPEQPGDLYKKLPALNKHSNNGHTNGQNLYNNSPVSIVQKNDIID